MPTEEIWKTFLVNAGLGAVILMAVGIAIWRVAKWLARLIEEWGGPIVQKHIEFLNKHLEFMVVLERKLMDTDKHQQEITATLVQQGTMLTNLSDSMKTQAHTLQLHATTQTQAISKIVDRLEILSQEKTENGK